MKVDIECLSCLVHRGYKEIAAATQTSALQFKAASAILECMTQKFNEESVAARLGTMRFRIIKRITGNTDIYKDKKRVSNHEAIQLLPFLGEIVDREMTPKGRFRKACLAAIAGNTIEFDIPEHSVSLEELKQLVENAEADLAIDDIDQILKVAKRAKGVLFLVDNAGEIAFDTILVRELKQAGAAATVVVKGGAILNDATLEDAKEVGMDKIADSVITTGTDSIELPPPDKWSNDLALAYSKAGLVIAKGMGYAETLPELRLRKPQALLLRTKCNPMARYFGVPRGRNVAKLIVPNGLLRRGASP